LLGFRGRSRARRGFQIILQRLRLLLRLPSEKGSGKTDQNRKDGENAGHFGVRSEEVDGEAHAAWLERARSDSGGLKLSPYNIGKSYLPFF